MNYTDYNYILDILNKTPPTKLELEIISELLCDLIFANRKANTRASAYTRDLEYLIHKYCCKIFFIPSI